MTLHSGNILKPSLDLVLFTSQLAKSLGVRGTLLLFGNYYLTVAILRAVTPAFGRLAAIEARLEGEYRAGMGRIGREGEEIAYVSPPQLISFHTDQLLYSFYDGGARERDILSSAYLRLIKHVNSIYKVRHCVCIPDSAYTLPDSNCVRVDRRLCYQVLVVGSRVWAHRCAAAIHTEAAVGCCASGRGRTNL